MDAAPVLPCVVHLRQVERLHSAPCAASASRGKREWAEAALARPRTSVRTVNDKGTHVLQLLMQGQGQQIAPFF